MEIVSVIKLLGGIALFLFGMKLMGDGLKSVAGSKLELILYRLSDTTFKGVLLGTGVTAVIQSSCATSVMAVGFVNSGMMKLRQAVSVILGAILGTSITGWIICLNYIGKTKGTESLFSSAVITAVVAAAGIILCMFVKKPTMKKLGGIMMGFAVLMYGMSAMSGAVGSLGDSEAFHTILTTLSHPILGVLAGAIFTAILQSASAAVGIIQALSVSGTITIGAAIPLLLGVTIGASLPVLLSALGATAAGKRASLIYPVSSVISVTVCAAVYYLSDAIFGFGFSGNTTDPFMIALLNSFIRLAVVLLLLPFTDVIEAVVNALVKEKSGEDGDKPLLEEIFISHPALAVDQSRTAMIEMANRSMEAIGIATKLVTEYTQEGFDRVAKLEESVDRYEDSLGSYLVKLTGRELTKQQNKDVSMFLHTLSDFERISDHALNIAESAAEIKDKKLVFSASAKEEMRVIFEAVNEILRLSVEAFISGSIEEAKRIEPLEELIDVLCDKSKLNHIERLQNGECTVNLGFVLNDLLTNFERVSDHCSNVAAAMIELEYDEFDTHEYLDRIKNKRSAEFEEQYEAYEKRYEF